MVVIKTGPGLRSDYSIIKEIDTDYRQLGGGDPSPFYTNERDRSPKATVSAEPFSCLPMSLLDVQCHSEM